MGKKGVRPYDMLTVFRKTLAPGSTRLKVFDTVVKRARKLGRLPAEAKEVFDEVVIKLRRTIRETVMQKQERVEREFDQLQMGKLSHSTFRAEWEYCLEELEDAGVDLPSQNSLYRKYLRKLSPELRAAVLRQAWEVVPGELPRRPKAWEEVADCVEMELETRADAVSQPHDSLHANVETQPPSLTFGPAAAAAEMPGLRVCVHRARSDHPSELCPKRAALLRGEVEKCVADAERGGRVCALCRASDHREEHHQLAALDYAGQAGLPHHAAGGSQASGTRPSSEQGSSSGGQGWQARPGQ